MHDSIQKPYSNSEQSKREDMFGNDATKTIDLVGYADEIKMNETNEMGERWSYIGVLFILEDKLRKAYRILEEGRNVEEDVRRYNKEIHFSDMTGSGRVSRKPKVAQNWLEQVARDPDDNFHFVVLGLNHEELDRDMFGESNPDVPGTIHNRFFRTALSQGINGFFGNHDRVTLVEMYHDQTSKMERHDYFSWHALWKTDQRYDFLNSYPREMTFLDSNHRSEGGHEIHSHFIQLIDVILGASRQCLDDPNSKDGCIEAAEDEWIDLMVRLTDGNANPNSRYNYLGRCSVSFFPKTIPPNIQDHINGVIYEERPLLLKDRKTPLFE